MDFFQVIDTGDGYQQYHPDIFSLSATMEMPTGIATLNLVSLCPTNYTIFPTVDKSTITFFTTSADLITVNVKVVGDAHQCNFQQTSVSYSSSRPLSINVPACGSQYVNVYLLTSLTGCYPGSGIAVRVQQQANPSALVPPQINSAITFQTDQVQLALAQSMDAGFQLQYQLISGALLAPDLESFNNVTSQAIEKYITVVVNNTVNTGNITEWAEQLQAEIENRTQQIQASLGPLWAIVYNMSQLMNNNTYYAMLWQNAFDAALLEYNKLEYDYAQSKAASDALSTFVENLINKNNQECNNNIPILGPIICGIQNGINGLFNGLGTLFMWIVYIVIICAFAYCFIVCCAPLCCRSCSSAAESLQRKWETRQKNKENRKRSSMTTTKKKSPPSSPRANVRGHATDSAELAKLLRKDDGTRFGDYASSTSV